MFNTATRRMTNSRASWTTNLARKRKGLLLGQRSTFGALVAMVVLAGFIIIACSSTHALAANCSAEGAAKEWFPPLNPKQGLIDYNTSQPAGWGSCFQYSRATCCEKNQTDVVTRMVILMERASFSPACIAATEKVLCSLACDPDVGLGVVKPVACADTCENWRLACAEDFFSSSTSARSLMPCSDSALVCSKAEDMYSTGAEFCEAMSVRSSDSPDCVSGEVDPSRRGTVRPVERRFSGSKPTSQTLLDGFYRDLARFERFLNDAFGKYTRSIDSIVSRLLGLKKVRSFWWIVVLAGFIGLIISLALRSAWLRTRDEDFR